MEKDWDGKEQQGWEMEGCVRSGSEVWEKKWKAAEKKL